MLECEVRGSELYNSKSICDCCGYPVDGNFEVEGFEEEEEVKGSSIKPSNIFGK